MKNRSYQEDIKDRNNESLLFKYIITTIVITAILFLMVLTIRVLNKNYFLEHKYYAVSYTSLLKSFSLINLVVPVLIVLILSIKFLLQKVNKNNYFRSLLIPCSFALTTLVLHLPAIYYFEHSFSSDTGSISLMIVIVYVILVVVLTAIINGLITYFKNIDR